MAKSIRSKKEKRKRTLRRQRMWQLKYKKEL